MAKDRRVLVGNTAFTFPCEMDMRAGTEDWCAAFKKLIFSQKFLEKVRKDFVRKLKAKRGSFKVGQIWEERT